MQTWTWGESTDFPPSIRRDGEDVYDLLRANRFDEAKDAVKTWRGDNPIRLLIEGEDFQTAICDLGSILFPQRQPHGFGDAIRALERDAF
jgi:hypothetical protein